VSSFKIIIHFSVAYWNRNGCTALHYAVDGSQMETVELALDEGADREAKDSEQWTPLMRGGWWNCKGKYPFITLNLVNFSLCIK